MIVLVIKVSDVKEDREVSSHIFISSNQVQPIVCIKGGRYQMSRHIVCKNMTLI